MSIAPETNNTDTKLDYVKDLENTLRKSIDKSKSLNNKDYVKDLEDKLAASISNKSIKSPAKPSVSPAKPSVSPAKPSVSPAKPSVSPKQPSVSPKQPSVSPDDTDEVPEVKQSSIDSSFSPFSILKLGDSPSKSKQSRGVLTSKKVSDVDTNIDPDTEPIDDTVKSKDSSDSKKDTLGDITKGITKGFSDLFKDISTSTSDATSAVKRNMKLTPSTSKESETPAKSEKSTTSLKSIRSSKSTKSLDSKNILKATDSAIKMTGIFSFFSWKVIGIIIAVIIILLLIINFIFSGSKLNIVQEIIKLVGNLISLIANFGKDSSVDIISDSADIIDDTIDSVDTAVGIKGTQRNMINNDSNPSNENIAVGSNTFNIKPDDMDSSTQKAKHVKSASYCYIGEDRGFRSCLQVEKGDKCMSGDIFPSKELCINPNLRQ